MMNFTIPGQLAEDLDVAFGMYGLTAQEGILALAERTVLDPSLPYELGIADLLDPEQTAFDMRRELEELDAKLNLEGRAEDGSRWGESDWSVGIGEER